RKLCPPPPTSSPLTDRQVSGRPGCSSTDPVMAPPQTDAGAAAGQIDEPIRCTSGIRRRTIPNRGSHPHLFGTHSSHQLPKPISFWIFPPNFTNFTKALCGQRRIWSYQTVVVSKK